MAVLVAGLGDKSRIKKKITGVKLDIEQQLLAIIADRLGALINTWGGKIDFSIYDNLMEHETEKKGQVKGQAFSSIEEFNKARYGGWRCQVERH